jgi:alpha-galactosidase
MPKDTVRIAFIGAGSAFCPKTINDLYLDDALNEFTLDIRLMDIHEERLALGTRCARGYAEVRGRKPCITSTTDLDTAVDGCDFVITAIERDRFRYWAMDFHIPRRYGFNQVFGENGGPGGMFHYLRNVGPMMDVARAMERLCPDALFINYSNPEAKLVETVTKLTKIKAVGLCHGIWEGQELVSKLLGIPEDEFEAEVCGLNHFGWYQKIRRKSTGEDLYPLLRERERSADWLHLWDAYALPRMLLRTYGLLPYPVTSHVAEYIRWADGFIASPNMQLFFDPVNEDPFAEGAKSPHFIFWANDFAKLPLFDPPPLWLERKAAERFGVNPDMKFSGESGVPIITAMTKNQPIEVMTANLPNRGCVPGLPDDMVLEIPATADSAGLRGKPMEALPAAVTGMIAVQGVIHQLLIEAYREKSRNKLLQAVLFDPTVSSYQSAVAMINEMCGRQKDALPELSW